MSGVYYEIQLTARQLTVGLVLLALALVAAFLLGYGAGSSMRGAPEPAPARAGGLAEEVLTPPPGVTPSGAVATASPTPSPRPTATPTAAPAGPTPAPTVTPRPIATATPRPTATPAPEARPARRGYWVQVLAARHAEAVAKARSRLVELDFPRNRHWVVQTPTAEGVILYKVRVGPFPDRQSAERVARRMRVSGFPDAWVVAP